LRWLPLVSVKSRRRLKPSVLTLEPAHAAVASSVKTSTPNGTTQRQIRLDTVHTLSYRAVEGPYRTSGWSGSRRGSRIRYHTDHTHNIVIGITVLNSAGSIGVSLTAAFRRSPTSATKPTP